jgi:propionaldehyde dehydrogenase
MTIDRKQVELIVEKVLESLSSSGQSSSANNPSPAGSGGVFQEMEDAIQAAAVAQQALVRLPLSTRERIIQCMRDVGWANREAYGRLELEETDLARSMAPC